MTRLSKRCVVDFTSEGAGLVPGFTDGQVLPLVEGGAMRVRLNGWHPLGYRTVFEPEVFVRAGAVQVEGHGVEEDGREYLHDGGNDMGSIFDSPSERYRATSSDTRLPGPAGAMMSDLTNQGVLGAINALVLHPLGYALGVSRGWRDSSSPVRAIQLYKTDDPEGVVFDPAAAASLIEKLEAAGHRELAAQVRKAYPAPMEGGDQMDPKTEAEKMEDTRPEGRGFVDDQTGDAEALEQIASHDDETAEDRE